MNYRMIDALVTLHTQEMRRQAAQRSMRRQASRPIAGIAGPAGLGTDAELRRRAVLWGAGPGSSTGLRRPAAAESRPMLGQPAGLRNRIGFALIEAGLRLSVPASGREPSPTAE
jgi:hypothetical protein